MNHDSQIIKMLFFCEKLIYSIQSSFQLDHDNIIKNIVPIKWFSITIVVSGITVIFHFAD